MQQSIALAEVHGEGPSKYQDHEALSNEFSGNMQTPGFNNALNARVVENM